LTAVVVLPTPPFWLARAITFDILFPPFIYKKTLAFLDKKQAAHLFYIVIEAKIVMGLMWLSNKYIHMY
jgi:hypothetical protein